MQSHQFDESSGAMAGSATGQRPTAGTDGRSKATLSDYIYFVEARRLLR